MCVCSKIYGNIIICGFALNFKVISICEFGYKLYVNASMCGLTINSMVTPVFVSLL